MMVKMVRYRFHGVFLLGLLCFSSVLHASRPDGAVAIGHRCDTLGNDTVTARDRDIPIFGGRWVVHGRGAAELASLYRDAAKKTEQGIHAVSGMARRGYRATRASGCYRKFKQALPFDRTRSKK